MVTTCVNFNKRTKAFDNNLSGLLMVLSVNAQTGTTINVRGTITDIAGEPIIGANILIQNLLWNSYHYDGNYLLQAPADGVLEVKLYRV